MSERVDLVGADGTPLAWGVLRSRYEALCPPDDLARLPQDAFVKEFWNDMRAATAQLQEAGHGAGAI